MKYAAEEKILSNMLDIHEEAVFQWGQIYDVFFQNKGNVNKMRKGVQNISSIILSLILKPTLETEKVEELDEVLRISSKTRAAFDESAPHIRTAVEDGIVTNHGTVEIIPAPGGKNVLLRRRAPDQIAKYETAGGVLWVADLIEKKLWCKDKIFRFENKKIIKEEPNIGGIIPFVFFYPHRIEYGGTKRRGRVNRIYGAGETELKSIQERLTTLGESWAETINQLLDPAILYSHQSAVDESEIDKLVQPGGRLGIDDINAIKPFSHISQLSINAVGRAEARINAELAEKTGQTELTTGISTKTGTSGSLIREMKQSMLMGLKPYEDAYFLFFRNAVRTSARVLMMMNALDHIKINVDELRVEKWDRDIDAQESIVLYQTTMSLLGGLPNVPAKLDIMAQIIKPPMMKILSKTTHNPESVMRSFDKAIEEVKQQMQAQAAQQQEVTNDGTSPKP